MQFILLLGMSCKEIHAMNSCRIPSCVMRHADYRHPILSYLQGTKHFGLRYGPSVSTLIGFSDADFARKIYSLRSTSGSVFLLNGGSIGCRCSRQQCVSLSTTKTEYVALSEAAKESVWLRRLILEIVPDWNQPLPLMCDNISAIEFSKSTIFLRKTNHIQVRFHFIREQQKSKKIDVKYVSTYEQLADLPQGLWPNLVFFSYAKRLA